MRGPSSGWAVVITVPGLPFTACGALVAPHLGPGRPGAQVPKLGCTLVPPEGEPKDEQTEAGG